MGMTPRNGSIKHPDRHRGYRVKEVDLSEVPNHLFAHLKEANPSEVGVLTPESINEDVEGWILQCPRNINLPSILQSKKLRLNGDPSILTSNEDLVNGEVGVIYEAVATLKEGDENMFLILPDGEQSFKLASIPLNGFITVRKHIEEIEIPEVTIPRKRTRKLPKGIKERHPVYGVDFLTPKVKTRKRKHESPRNSPSKKLKLDYDEDTTDFVEKLRFSSKNKKKRKA